MNYKFKIFTLLFTVTHLVGEDIVLPTHNISFTGQTFFKKPKLENALGIDHKSFFEFWKKDSPVIKDKLIPTLKDSISSFYASQGFYDTKTNIKLTKDNVVVNIDANKPVKVNKINIQSDYDISSFIKAKTGKTFRAKTFITSKNDIIEALLKDGYCSYDLDTKAYVDLDKHSVDLKYTLKKGGICTFGKLSLFGLKTIDKKIVISKIRALEGKRFSTKLVQKTSNSLYNLGAFDSVLINVDRKIYNVIPVDISFEEIENPYHLEVGAGYDTYEGSRVHGDITKYNFLGDAQKLNFRASWSKLEQLSILSYFKPAFLKLSNYGIDFGSSIGYSNLKFDGFKEEKSFVKAYFLYDNDKTKLKAGIASEVININALANLNSNQYLIRAVNEGNFILFYPYIDFIYDARDSKLNPKHGYYFATYSEFGISREAGSSSYIKVELEARAITTFKNLTLAMVGKIGTLNDKTGTGLPESKYFFGGGSYSNRAYGFRQMGVIVSNEKDTIYGASSMTNLSLEADYPIWGNIYGAVFNDNTMLNDKSYSFKGDIISSAGVGVRYVTPIGPFKLDVAFNTNNPSIYGVSFQIGQSF